VVGGLSTQAHRVEGGGRHGGGGNDSLGWGPQGSGAGKGAPEGGDGVRGTWGRMGPRARRIPLAPPTNPVWAAPGPIRGIPFPSWGGAIQGAQGARGARVSTAGGSGPRAKGGRGSGHPSGKGFTGQFIARWTSGEGGENPRQWPGNGGGAQKREPREKHQKTQFPHNGFPTNRQGGLVCLAPLTLLTG